MTNKNIGKGKVDHKYLDAGEQLDDHFWRNLCWHFQEDLPPGVIDVIDYIWRRYYQAILRSPESLASAYWKLQTDYDEYGERESVSAKLQRTANEFPTKLHTTWPQERFIVEAYPKWVSVREVWNGKEFVRYMMLCTGMSEDAVIKVMHKRGLPLQTNKIKRSTLF